MHQHAQRQHKGRDGLSRTRGAAGERGDMTDAELKARIAELDQAVTDPDVSISTLLAHADAHEELVRRKQERMTTIIPPEKATKDDEFVTWARLERVVEIIAEETKRLMDHEYAAVRAQLEQLRRDMVDINARERRELSNSLRATLPDNKPWKQQRRVRNNNAVQ